MSATTEDRHTATVHLSEPHEGNTEYYFASPDGGEHYIGVSRLPESDEDWQEVKQLILGTETFKPMTYAANGIWMVAASSNATVEFHDAH